MLRSYNKLSLCLPTLLLSVTIFSGLVLAGSSVSADDSMVSDVTITIPSSCTFSGTGTNSHTANINNGTYTADIGTTTLKAYCNDMEGFSIYAAGYTGDEIGGTNSTKLVGQNSNQTIMTGTATTAGNPDISNWAMKLGTVTSPTPTYPITIDNGFSSYSQVPSTYTKVAHRDSGTDAGTNAEGATLTATYAAYISKTQTADTYNGKVKYTMVHPASEEPLGPQATDSGKICYYANASDAVGIMYCDTIPSETYTGRMLQPSDFGRDGYGFAGWSDRYDYETNPNANFYGPISSITFEAGQYTAPNPGLSLYAVWVKSEGSLQDSNKVASLCGTGSGSLTQATANGVNTLDSVSALTDERDGKTYAIAKLADGNCWMIENLKLDNTAELTISNTNNPLNDGVSVTLKHNYADLVTYNTLSTPTELYFSESAPDFCDTDSADCVDQSRLAIPADDDFPKSFGNYYNWYSATAGRGTYSQTSGNAEGDICPFGWRLPTGGSNGEFYALNVAANSGATNSAKGLKAFPNNFIYNGVAHSGGLSSFDMDGRYWSSTAGMSSQGGVAYELYFNEYYSTYVSPGTSPSSKNQGVGVRCLASGS